MKKLIVWLVAAAVALVLAFGLYWQFELRGRPKTITKNQVRAST